MEEEPLIVIKNNRSCPNCGSSGSNRPIILKDGTKACTYCATQCPSCGDMTVYKEDNVDDEGHYICPDCLGKYTRCSECDHLVPEDHDECHSCMTSEYICSDCGEACEDDHYTTASDDTICGSCRDENYSYCEHCDQIFHNDDVNYIELYGRYVCNDCLNSRYTRCVHCEEYRLDDTMVECNGDSWCEDCTRECLYVCERCGHYVHQDDYTNVYTDETHDEIWCEDCTNDHASFCSGCDQTFALAANHSCNEEDDDED